MANYNLVVDSTFTPFTYEQYLKPFLEYKEAYQDMENKVSALQEQADTLEILANNSQDADVYNQYKAYSDQLHNMANELSTKGLSPNSRSSYLGMKARYSKEIVPIQNAYTARAAEAEAQYKGKAQGMVYEKDAANTPLSEYIKNPLLKQGMADSTAGYKRLYTAAQALSKIASKDYDLLKSPDPYTARILQEYGTDPETIKQDINQAMADIQSGNIQNLQNNTTIQSLLKTEMQTSGVANWQNPEAQLDYLTKVAPALYAAIGESKVSEMALFGKRLAAQTAAEINAYREKLNMQQPNPNGGNGGSDPTITTVDNGERTLSGVVGNNKKKQKNVENYNNFKNNKWVNSKNEFTVKAVKELKEFIKGGRRGEYTRDSMTGEQIPTLHTQHLEELYNVVKQAGITDQDILNFDGKRLGKVQNLNRYFKEVSSPDYNPAFTYDVSVYTHKILASNEQDKLREGLKTLRPDVTLYPVKGVNEDGTLITESSGKKIGEISDTAKPNMLSVVPTELGTAMVNIDGVPYKLTQADLRDLLGEGTFARYVAACNQINLAETTGQKEDAIQKARSYLARAFSGSKSSDTEGDLTKNRNNILNVNLDEDE